jgi:hypothetical protein
VKDKDKLPDELAQDLSGWHELLGWGDGSDSIAPYVPTPMSVVRSMLEIAGVGPGDTLYDLGCGDGRIVVMAVEEFNADKAVGFELNKHLVETALESIRSKGLDDRVSVLNENIMEVDLSPASVVTLYLTTTGNAKLRFKFIEELSDGTRIISHDFPIIDWVQDTKDMQPIQVGTHKIFTYTMPSAYKQEPEKDDKPSDRWQRIKKILDRL